MPVESQPAAVIAVIGTGALDQRPEGGGVVVLPEVAELVDDDVIKNRGRASSRRQLKLRLPRREQLPQRVFCDLMATLAQVKL